MTSARPFAQCEDELWAATQKTKVYLIPARISRLTQEPFIQLPRSEHSRWVRFKEIGISMNNLFSVDDINTSSIVVRS